MKGMSTGLALLLPSAYFFYVVAGSTCESDDGQRSIECDDDDICCEHNGDLSCCTASELWWAWLLIGIMVLVVAVLGIVGCCLCFYCHRKDGCSSNNNNYKPQFSSSVPPI